MIKKRLIFLALLGLLSTLLGGCEVLDTLRERILSQGKKTVESVGKTATDLKESVEQKVKDVQRAAAEVQEAAKQVEEAIDAVKKVTGEGAPAPEAAGTTTQSMPPASPQQLSLE